MQSYLNYSPREFVAHAGVCTLVAHLREAAKRDQFSLLFVQGAARTGKTHLAIYVSDLLGGEGCYPRIIEGRELAERIAELNPVDATEVLILDDAHHYLDNVTPGESGPMVRLVESYRRACAKIIILSSKPLGEFQFDQHISSRLSSGAASVIADPAAQEMERLVTAMARQRGLKLSEKKIQYLVGRLNRSVSAVEEYLEKLGYLARVLGRNINFPLLADAL